MYTTKETLEEEFAVVSWAVDAVQPLARDRGPAELKERVSAFADRELAGGQLAAAAAAAGDGEFELIVGPARTGKTTALKAAVASLSNENRAVFGLAPSGVAARVLGEETGCQATNVTKFLWEHTQRRTGPRLPYQIGAGATVLVDEAGMVRTSDWSRLCALADKNDWRIVAVGDGYQFSAVGRGGMFEHLAAVLPTERVTHLDRVHRFTNAWEADASLKLRHGDADGLVPYFENGRCMNLETPPEALNEITARWAKHEAAGEEFAVFCARNEIVDVVNGKIQEHRRDAGLASSRNTIAGRSHQLGVGDHIVARQNDRGILTDRDRWVRNRDRFTITQVSADGVRAVGDTGSVVLRADYLKEHVELGYAQTSHAGQGRTVDHSLLLIDQTDKLDRAGMYVPLTRGRTSNRVLTVSGADPAPSYTYDMLNEALQRRWVDAPAVSHLETDDPQEQLATVKALLRDIAQRIATNRDNNKRRAHPLHRARAGRLRKHHKTARAERDALQVATASAAKEQAIRDSFRKKRRQIDGPDQGLGL
jgi:ATP-dependent exoDNAse (exonuclease V) alpha subunit